MKTATNLDTVFSTAISSKCRARVLLLCSVLFAFATWFSRPAGSWRSQHCPKIIENPIGQSDKMIKKEVDSWEEYGRMGKSSESWLNYGVHEKIL